MSMSSLLRTQWADYPHTHADRLNFLVHLLTVPVFMAGTTAIFWGFCVSSMALSVAGLAAMIAALAAQAWGHRRESTAPAPFTGPGNAFARLVLEQWVTFPRYVLRRLSRRG